MSLIERHVDIFYVEDDEIDILSVKRAFRNISKDISIEVAHDGDVALNQLYGIDMDERIHPHIILLDINMPRMNGIEFLKRLRSDGQYADVGVYILTGAYTTQDKLAMQDLNVCGQIIKPLEYSDALTLYWALQH